MIFWILEWGQTGLLLGRSKPSAKSQKQTFLCHSWHLNSFRIKSNFSIFISNNKRKKIKSLLSETLLSGLKVKKPARQKSHQVTLSIYFKCNNLSFTHCDSGYHCLWKLFPLVEPWIFIYAAISQARTDMINLRLGLRQIYSIDSVIYSIMWALLLWMIFWE